MSYTVPKKDFPNIIPSQVPMVLASAQPAFPAYTIIPAPMCSNPTMSNPAFHPPPSVAGPPSLAPVLLPPSTVTLLPQSQPGNAAPSNYQHIVNSRPIHENILTIPNISNRTVMHNPAFVDPVHTSDNVCDLKIHSVESLAPLAHNVHFVPTFPTPPIVPTAPPAPPAPSIGSDTATKKRKTIRIPRRKSIETDKDRRIRRLEKKLAIYHASIEEAGNVEIGLDDLGGEDNPLERLHRLEKKAAQIWEEICQLKGKSDRIMVISDSFKNVNCTPYPSVNHRIERFFMRNILDLPDIVDVSEMISKVNEKEKLSLSKEEISRLSKRVLQFVGNRMSQRRRTDLYEVLRSRTEEGADSSDQDPFIHDPAFKARLEENEASFKKQLQDTIGVFCEKQDKLGLNGENDPGIVEGDPSIGADGKDKNLLCELEDSPNLSPFPISSCPEHTALNSPGSSTYETAPDHSSPPSFPSLKPSYFSLCRDSAPYSSSKRVKMERKSRSDTIVISSDEEIDQN